ncbi:MAG TPA: hypothetical protein PL009_06810 [Flavipsychrobacter sp.]|nr:hypothetical protein [Flavipsychrobacter sp.]
MKKILIGSLVGGLIIFIWQFISNAAIDFHYKAHQYTEQQDAILNSLSQLPEGGYIMPSLPKTATQQEWEQYMKEKEGKPWAMVQYHNSMQYNMGMNMARGYIVNVLTVALFCWMLLRMRPLSFGRVMTASLFIGLIVFMNGIYTGHIWYQFFDTSAHLSDAVASWVLAGLWLGWWLPRGNKEARG